AAVPVVRNFQRASMDPARAAAPVAPASLPGKPCKLVSAGQSDLGPYATFPGGIGSAREALAGLPTLARRTRPGRGRRPPAGGSTPLAAMHFACLEPWLRTEAVLAKLVRMIEQVQEFDIVRGFVRMQVSDDAEVAGHVVAVRLPGIEAIHGGVAGHAAK